MRILYLAILMTFAAFPAYATTATAPAAEMAAPAPEAAPASDQAKAVPSDINKVVDESEKTIDLKTLRARAAKGDPGAQDMLGNHYEEGSGGVKQDTTKAAKWYYRAAMQGYAKAQADLAVLYIKGEGVPQDYTQAYFWMTLSLDPFDAGSASLRDNIAKYLSPEQLSEQQRRLNEWRPNMEQGNSGEDAEDAGCTAKDVSASMTPPKRNASKNCKEAFKNMRFACSGNSCTDCEVGFNKYNAACSRPDMEADPAFACEKNADCFLVDINCSTVFDPISVNREYIQQIRKARNYPLDCGRSPETKAMFHAICDNAICSVKKDGPPQ